jgi:3-deoxy-manno-octulosonate cytidylyltransferase (CMP-KDO synthetase)
MKFIAIIPARYGSTRLPGKPLININGIPMVQRVYERVKQVIDDVYVATDDVRISEVVESFGGKAIMTAKNHESGTDRCAEAIEIIHSSYSEKFDVIINVQGDEPFIYPEQISKVMSCFDHKGTQISTLVKPINNSEDIFNPNKPKVVLNNNNEAIFFSRSPIPFIKNDKEIDWIKHKFYKHIGIYAYRYDILKKITKLEPSYLEKSEMLEQLRWIENRFKIKVEFTEHESISIDTKRDLQKINQTGLL